MKVEFTYAGQESLRQLNSGAQDAVLSVLDDLNGGHKDRSEVLEKDAGGKYHYFEFEFSGESYTVVVDLTRHYSGLEDELAVVDMGPTSDFLLDS
ncbi:hypothetical protein [Halobaculum sp. MBLA0143]|uniref:hypothetical protein n=1 Tax=Halobaculum sp. MBLA0143 TaxID=3079933 RepID=UPI003526AB62